MLDSRLEGHLLSYSSRTARNIRLPTEGGQPIRQASRPSTGMGIIQ
jgi:hypothetical protein